MKHEPTTIDWTALLERLAEPFPADAVSWRAGAINRDRTKAQALAYVDPRAYEDRLDAVLAGGWGVAFKPWGDSRLVCELTIHGVTRSSTGEFDASDKISQGTTAEAQAFKRACSKFGLGRYLYDLPLTWVAYDSERNRLAETPRIPDRYVPRPTDAAADAGTLPLGPDPKPTRAKRPGRNATDGPTPATDVGPTSAPMPRTTLTPERATAMFRELEKLGYDHDEGLRLAAFVTRSNVDAYTDLTEAQAIEVWQAARKANHRNAA